MDAKQEIENWCEMWSFTNENLFVSKLRQAQLTDNQILIVIRAMSDICKDCYDSELPCYCMGDD